MTKEASGSTSSEGGAPKTGAPAQTAAESAKNAAPRPAGSTTKK